MCYMYDHLAESNFCTQYMKVPLKISAVRDNTENFGGMYFVLPPPKKKLNLL